MESRPMPVIVIGADTELGHAVVAALQPASGEIRVLASDADQVDRYRSAAKVAVGDISDGTHVGGAAIGAFCAIVIATSAHDDRERHFASDPEALFAQWADGLADAEIRRVIVVGRPAEIPKHSLNSIGAEYAHIDTTEKSPAQVAAEVAATEAAAEI